ncbi:MAG: NAD-dependent epimerase/dehydratase family protein [Rhodospirillales bacterium]|nr:NAD-dependent epimerase/dehydratase family protein [Rhodospirillales bacterium]
MTRVLVTGATGFIGRAVCRHLAETGWEVVAAVRSPQASIPGAARVVWVGEVDQDTDWGAALDGVRAVVHLTSPAHILRAPTPEMRETLHTVNVLGSRCLAEAAAAAGVRHFVHLSTIKVNGEDTEPGHPFTEAMAPRPRDPYGQSKWETEQILHAVAASTGLSLTILRPPLVYGPGVKGNLLGLVKACSLGLPLPLGGARNRRSLLNVDNLADAIATCLKAPEIAAGKTYVLRDGRDISTAELVAMIGRNLPKPPCLPAVPEGMMMLAGRLFGLQSQVQRLLGSLTIDDAGIRAELGWVPPRGIEDGIAAMVGSFLAEQVRGSRPPPVVFQSRPAIPGVSAVVVSYNNSDLAAMLIAALADPTLVELIVVNNGNDPATLREVKALARRDSRMRLVSGHGNVGFATGCNIGAALARGEFLLLLNPDCFIEAGTLERLVVQLGGLAGPWIAGVRLANADGSEQKGARRNLGTPFQWLVEAFRFDKLPWGGRMPQRVNMNEEPLPSSVTAVPAISGAFMFMPRPVYEQVGGMDQRYFLHFEDLDFCIEVRQAGGKIFFCPDITLLHKKSQSKASPLFVEAHKCRSMRIYFLKHFAAGSPKATVMAVWALLSAGLIVRGLYRNVCGWWSDRLGGGSVPQT